MQAQVFHHPRRQAAAELGVSVASLKTMCIKLNMTRWPHRKIASLHQLKSFLLFQPLKEQHLQQEHLAAIEEELAAVQRDPNHTVRSSLTYLRRCVWKRAQRMFLGTGLTYAQMPFGAEPAAHSSGSEDDTEDEEPRARASKAKARIKPSKPSPHHKPSSRPKKRASQSSDDDDVPCRPTRRAATGLRQPTQRQCASPVKFEAIAPATALPPHRKRLSCASPDSQCWPGLLHLPPLAPPAPHLPAGNVTSALATLPSWVPAAPLAPTCPAQACKWLPAPELQLQGFGSTAACLPDGPPATGCRPSSLSSSSSRDSSAMLLKLAGQASVEEDKAAPEHWASVLAGAHFHDPLSTLNGGPAEGCCSSSQLDLGSWHPSPPPATCPLPWQPSPSNQAWCDLNTQGLFQAGKGSSLYASDMQAGPLPLLDVPAATPRPLPTPSWAITAAPSLQPLKTSQSAPITATSLSLVPNLAALQLRLPQTHAPSMDVSPASAAASISLISPHGSCSGPCPPSPCLAPLPPSPFQRAAPATAEFDLLEDPCLALLTGWEDGPDCGQDSPSCCTAPLPLSTHCQPLDPLQLRSHSLPACLGLPWPSQPPSHMAAGLQGARDLPHGPFTSGLAALLDSPGQGLALLGSMLANDSPRALRVDDLLQL
ncbi:hypothetical protein V8C86DRAFT_3181177 [Haematococcus lacustris]